MINSSETVLEVKNLSKHFSIGGLLSSTTIKAVQNASFTLHPAEVLALVGESGSGKSTIVRMLAQLYKPTSGHVIFQGRDVTHIKRKSERLEYLSKVQMIFQDPYSSLNPAHTIGYQLSRPFSVHHKGSGGKAARQKRVLELLERVALTPAEQYINKYPHQLSGGQRQRVAIARALAVEPAVILADEPISMLDVSIRLGVLNLMAALRDQENISFIYITHDLASARYFADEIMVMYAGVIVEKAGSEDLVMDPQHPYTHLLLSAVPNPEKGLRTEGTELVGEVPDLAELGVGCPFAPRCSKVMDKCWSEMPPATQITDRRWVRCFLYE
jgi:peptide/nickel transport system ATP-binding protein